MKDIIEAYAEVIMSVIGACAVMAMLVYFIEKYKDIVYLFMSRIMYR